jgi:hypothetical protein
MDVEDEIIEELGGLERIIAVRDKTINDQKRELDDKNKALDEQKRELDDQKQLIEELKQQLGKKNLWTAP